MTCGRIPTGIEAFGLPVFVNGIEGRQFFGGGMHGGCRQTSKKALLVWSVLLLSIEARSIGSSVLWSLLFGLMVC